MERLKAIGIAPSNFLDMPSFDQPKFENKMELTDKEKWDSVIWNINMAEQQGKRALMGLTIAFVRMIQAEILNKLLFDARTGSAERFSIEDLLWDKNLEINNDGSTMNDLIRKIENIGEC